MYRDTNEVVELKKQRDEALKRESQLRALVVAVRLAQVEYFHTRSKDSLVKSKSAESQLDKELFGKNLKFSELHAHRENDYARTTN